MKLSTLRRRGRLELPGIKGVARLDRRTKDLCKHLKPGDIAVIDHIDLDRASAEALVAARAAAVVNCAPSISGRYPNLGPGILLQAGIPLVDGVGDDAYALLSEGDRVRLDGKALYRGEALIAAGTEQTEESVNAALEEAKTGLATQLEALAANTSEYLRREHGLVLDGAGVPDVATKLEGRHVLVVARNYDYRDDLAALRPYLREHHPVLVGVDGGADALLGIGLEPDLIVGDMDAVSERALRSGAELVVHAYRDGRAPGLDRLERLGLEAVVFPATGTSEDVALLLADSNEAALIVGVGTHGSLVEFLDRGRTSMASTFLTRLRVGATLVDAKSVRQLYRPRVARWQIALLLLFAVVALGLALAATPVGQEWLDEAVVGLEELYAWGRGLLP